MALLKAVALGTIAAIGLPFILRDGAGMVGAVAQAGAYRPPVGGFAFVISGPIFMAVTGFGWLLLKAAEER